MDWTDFDAFQALPRVGGLALSPDGTRLITSSATLDPKKQKWVTALWEVDPTGARPATRLTRSAKGEGGPVFTDAGEVLFVSGRPDPGEAEHAEEPALWSLPTTGEARPVGTRPGGVSGPKTRGTKVVVLSDTLPSAVTTEDDAERRKARKDRSVSAILHTGSPVRFWDHDLGPGQNRLLMGDLTEDPISWQDLTPTPGRALDNASYDVTPDGATVVTTWAVQEPHGSSRTTLRAVDVASGEHRVLGDGAENEYGEPVVSPDGTQVAVLRWDRSTATDPGDVRVVVMQLDGSGQRVVEGWDRWPTSLTWDGADLLVTADEGGSGPIFRVTAAGVTRLTLDDGTYTDVCVHGDSVYALRSGYDGPAAPVRLDAGLPTPLQGAAPALTMPGALSEVTATASDGRPLRAWLVTPEGDGPHPFVLWVHGGPLASWNAWSWRWCPWLLVAQGYAVLLPDPALSTGYGLDHIRASWGDWGGAAYTDILTLTDVALERPDLDASRTAMMGGSFGGYMANWIAGHTDRFRAIVTHASLWDLTRFGGSTDAPWYWAREMTPEMVRKNDPSQFIGQIVTPLLVIHGDRDYRVPIGEGLTLWTDLCSQAKDPQTMPHRFLYFPDENHWVLTPGHAVVWYQTVLSYLAQHVLGCQEDVPTLLN